MTGVCSEEGCSWEEKVHRSTIPAMVRLSKKETKWKSKELEELIGKLKGRSMTWHWKIDGRPFPQTQLLSVLFFFSVNNFPFY